MPRLRSRISLGCCFALAGVAPVFPATSENSASPSIDIRVAAPYSLTIRSRTWDGNTHGLPSGRAVLAADGQSIWELADVTNAVASADGSLVALLTGDFQVFVSRLPEPPQRLEGGPYLGPAISRDGTFLVAQRLGKEGHILEKTFNTQGIALINLDTGEDRLIVQGNDVYSPSFASDDKLFFGSGGADRTASLYLLNLNSMYVARVTNREKDARQTFPSEIPQLAGGTVAYRADDVLFRVPAPAPGDFAPVGRFEAPAYVAAEGRPGIGGVRIRTPSTQVGAEGHIYFDVGGNGPIKDWSCGTKTYNNHKGTDITQAIGYAVVAPASGQVIERYDGCPSTNSWGCGQGWGNHVTIKHSDGTSSLEAHGQTWTVVPLGNTYGCGATLMKSASSGNSTLPHIHHESWKGTSFSTVFDPFYGPCDSGDPSKWNSQGPYLGVPGTVCTN